MLKNAHITGWGSYLPDKILTNDALSNFVDTSDEWIYQRTGIRERRIAGHHETTTAMATAAGRDALAVAQLDPAEVDLIVVATLTPVQMTPVTACRVQYELGATKAGCLDLNAACSGFIYAMNLAAQSIATSAIKNALIIASDTLSRYIDWQDRDTCFLFGDGAGALVLQGLSRPGGLLATSLGADGSFADAITVPNIYPVPVPLPLVATATYEPLDKSIPDSRAYKDAHGIQAYIAQDGRTVVQKAVRFISGAISEVLDKANLTLDEVDLIIPHQANARIIKAGAKKLGIPYERFFINIDRVANTSSAAIPLALCDAVAEGCIEKGNTLVFVTFGGGMTWGSSVLQWSADVGQDATSHRRYIGK